MEEKNVFKINLSTILLLISLIVIVIMGCYIYKLYNEKQKSESQVALLTNQIMYLEDSIVQENIIIKSDSSTSVDKQDSDKSIDPNNYNFKLDSKNKYIVTTDYRWLTMMNDGGSNTNIYYQIDLDNNIVSQISEVYKANLSGTSNKTKNVSYTKKINNSISQEIKSLLNEVLSSEDKNEPKNYNSFVIETLNVEKDIYNTNTIKSLKELLKKIDELE